MIVDTANTSTGLGTSREPIAASAPATLHDTSEGPIIALDKPTAVLEEPIASSAPAILLNASEEPIAEPASAPLHNTSEEPIAESAPTSSLDKVRLSCPSNLYFLAYVCVLILVPVRILISPSCCPSIPHQLA